MNKEGWSFQCKDCGSTELYVQHEYSITEEIAESLECSCDEGNDFAAQKTYYVTTTYVDRMALDEEHHLADVEESEELDTTEEEGDYEVQCSKCLEGAQEGDWVTEVESSDIDEDSHEFYVCCVGCDREIEFGWSHPGRAGRIWPAECGDFNPWKSWPEPRYRAKWLERGWIRPDFRGNDRH